MKEQLLDDGDHELLRTAPIQVAELLIFVAAAFYFIKNIAWLMQAPLEIRDNYYLSIYAFVIMGVMSFPTIYAVLWRIASIKFDDKISNANPMRGLIVLFYLVSNLIVVLLFVVIVFQGINWVSVANAGGRWMSYFITFVQCLGIAILYAYYLFSTSNRSMKLINERKKSQSKK